MVERMIRGEMSDRWSPERTCWSADWHASVTEEQRLRAGMMRPSY